MPSTKNSTLGPSVFEEPITDKLFRAQQTYVRFLQTYFGKRPAGNFRWVQNLEETGILITGQSPDHMEVAHLRPVISVVRSNASWQGLSRDGVRERRLLDNSWTFTDAVSSSMVLNCIAKEPLEAQLIAYLSFVGIRIFKTVLMRYGRIHGIMNNMSMGPVSSAGQIVPPGSPFSEWRMVQVFCPFMVQETVTITDADEADFQVLASGLTITLDTVPAK